MPLDVGIAIGVWLVIVVVCLFVMRGASRV